MRKVIAILMMAAWAVGILYILWGPHLADLEARMEKVRQERYHWPAVQGRILDTKVHVPDNDSEYPTVTTRFQYSVSGTTYTAEQTWGYSDRDRKYQSGQMVTVYYDPIDSWKAVIELQRVDLYEVSAGWETLLRILAYPAIIVGCMVIWGSVVMDKPPQISSSIESLN